MTILISTISFAILALSAERIGQWFARIRMPLISGYMLSGILVGPFLLGLISSEAVQGLRFLEELSLGFIAFAAGSELYLKELRSRFKSIAWHTGGQLVAIYILGSVAIFGMSSFVPFMQNLPVSARIAMAILAAAILAARSPSSAIAIVNELRAKGPFTKTVLGVTVVMDVVVVVFFAINAALADVILTAEGFSPGFLVLLAVDLLLSLVLGYGVAMLLRLYLSSHLDSRLKGALILLTGLAVFFLSAQVRDLTHNNLPFEILLEPLLICMVGSFLVTNYSPYRSEFLKLIHDLGPAIYLIFFTLVGAALRLDILVQTFFIALAIFAVRLLGLFTGSVIGGRVSGDPPLHNRLAWMGYVTQAGVGLGLAREVAVEFPQLGQEFATLIVSAIVLSQLIGPPLFKVAIKRVGEAHLPGQATPDAVRDVLILGIEGQSRALARQLKANYWQVILADTDPTHVRQNDGADIDERHIPDISAASLSSLATSATDALVAMLPDDNANLKACELALEKFGIPRRIVRLNDMALAEKFSELGVFVVDPAWAMIHLLDNFVRAPQSATLLLHRDPEHGIAQITITDPDVDNLPLRDLRLPDDVLILGIMRDGHSIVPHGYTVLRLNDAVTVLGHPRTLEEVTRRLGY